MSWLFGKKKVKDSPPDSGEDAPPLTSHVDDYIIVDRQTSPASSIVGGYGDNTMKPVGMYPYLPPDQLIHVPSVPSNVSQMEILCDAPKYLNCIKFQLNKMLENDVEIDRLHADEIFSFILRIKGEAYDYDFSLENSVINEMTTSID